MLKSCHNYTSSRPRSPSPFRPSVHVHPPLFRRPPHSSCCLSLSLSYSRLSLLFSFSLPRKTQSAVLAKEAGLINRGAHFVYGSLRRSRSRFLFREGFLASARCEGGNSPSRSRFIMQLARALCDVFFLLGRDAARTPPTLYDYPARLL